jgi:hypothetical protein
MVSPDEWLSGGGGLSEDEDTGDSTASSLSSGLATLNPPKAPLKDKSPPLIVAFSYGVSGLGRVVGVVSKSICGKRV